MKIKTVNIDITTTEEYYEYAKLVAQTIHEIYQEYTTETDLQSLIDLIPPFKNQITANNYFDAKKKSELKTLKVAELKHILSVNCKKISGNKNILIDRVWGIHHKTEGTEKERRKKKKRHKKEVDIISVEDSEDELNIVEILRLCENIFIKNNRITKNRNKNYKRCYVKDKNWVFKEYNNRYEYIGKLEDRNLIKTAIPYEIESYLMCI